MTKDPLGITRRIEEVEQSHKQRPITKDEYEAWLNHPVTQRMHEEFAIMTHQAKDYAHDPACAARTFVLEQVVDWEPQELEND